MFKAAIFLSIAVLFNMVISVLYKQSSRTDKASAVIWIICAIGLSMVNAFCYTRSLSRINLSVAYPIFAAASMVLIAVGSSWIFSEEVSTRQALGMMIIVGGMALICVK